MCSEGVEVMGSCSLQAKHLRRELALWDLAEIQTVWWVPEL